MTLLHEKSVIGSVSHFSEIHKRPNFISPFIYKIISGFYAKKTPAVSFAEPVSYTHLDVYKRQVYPLQAVLSSAFFIFLGFFLDFSLIIQKLSMVRPFHFR